MGIGEQLAREHCLPRFVPRFVPRFWFGCQYRPLYAIAVLGVDFPKKKGDKYRYLSPFVIQSGGAGGHHKKAPNPYPASLSALLPFSVAPNAAPFCMPLSLLLPPRRSSTAIPGIQKRPLFLPSFLTLSATQKTLLFCIHFFTHNFFKIHTLSFTYCFFRCYKCYTCYKPHKLLFYKAFLL